MKYEFEVKLHSFFKIVLKFLSFTKNVEDHVNDVSFIDFAVKQTFHGFFVLFISCFAILLQLFLVDRDDFIRKEALATVFLTFFLNGLIFMQEPFVKFLITL